MLSYRHGFHAGNFADVHKHIILTLLLEALKKKPTPVCYLDTHAGAGVYDLQSEFAQKNREYETGIGRLWSLAEIPPALQPWIDCVRMANPGVSCRDNNLRFYPGSPAFAQQLLRADDRLQLLELHGTEVPLLKEQFAHDRRIGVHHRDAYEGLVALVPPPEKRGLVLIDPPYEGRDSFGVLTRALINAWKKWPTGVYVVWYPLQQRQPLPEFHYALRRAGIGRIYVSELQTQADSAVNRLAGSGMLIINPPWQSELAIAEVSHWLLKQLARDETARVRCQWLAGEND